MRNIYHCSYSSPQSLFLSNACDQRSLPDLKAFLPHQTQIVRHSPTHTNFMLLENYSFQISWARSFAGPVYSVGHDVLFSEGRLKQGEDAGVVSSGWCLHPPLQTPEEPSSRRRVPRPGNLPGTLSACVCSAPQQEPPHEPGRHRGPSYEMLPGTRNLPAPLSNSGAQKMSHRLGTGARGLGMSRKS